MHDDFVLRATEIIRGLLTDLPAGIASADEKSQSGSDHGGFHNCLLLLDIDVANDSVCSQRKSCCRERAIVR